MDTPKDIYTETPSIKLLRRLVMMLLIVMICGFIILITLFVIRFNATDTIKPLETLNLPQGVQPLTYTRAKDWYAIVGDDNIIRIYNLSDNTLRQRIKIIPQQ